MKRCLNIEQIKLITLNLGYELLSSECENEKTLITIVDSEGYYYRSNLLNIKRKDRTLKKFAKYNPFTVQNMRLWLKLNNKNFELVSDVYFNSQDKLKFKCLYETCGETFELGWNSVLSGVGCGYCNGKKVGKSNCLANNIGLLSMWHPTKNGDLTPYDVTCNSDKVVWWQCSKNPKHEWKNRIAGQNKNNNCPYCTKLIPSEEYNLLVCNPQICEEWNYEKNQSCPSNFLPNSGKKVWWKCKEGHEWESRIADRNSGKGCPYCYGRYATKDYNLLVCNPELCEEWDYKRNERSPNEYCPNSEKKVFWICKKCGHRWKAYINGRNNGNGCPNCNKSKGEKEIEKFLNSYDIEYVSQKEFYGLLGLGGGNLSYDFYIPNENILIEYQGEFHDGSSGIYAKSKLEIQKIHDKLKREYAINNSIELIEIWYWDFEKIEDILRLKLLN